MQDLHSQIQRQFTIPPPPCEPEYRYDRMLIQHVRRLPFKLFGRFLIVSYTPQLQSCYIKHIHDDIGFTIPMQIIETPAMDRAKLQVQPVELLANDCYPLAKFEDGSKKETYHRKNIIEKRRRKK